MYKKPISLIEAVSFIDKIVLISGASSGIGRAIAIRFAEAGAKLLLLDINKEGLQETVSILGSGCDVNCYSFDLSSKTDIDKFWGNINNKELPDIIVNNVGIYPIKDYLKVDEDYLKKTLDVNMNSTFWMCQKFIQKRGKSGGIIVNTSSIEAILPFKQDLVHYTMGKAGVIALTRSLARDYGALGFRANVILPGAIKTPGTKDLIKEAILKVKINLIKTGYDFNQRIANRKWGEPDDVAKAVVFLSSDLASYVQGAVLPIDGGFLSS